MNIAIGHQFTTSDGTVFTVSGRGLRNSYSLMIDGKSAGSIARDRMLQNIKTGAMVYHGSVAVPKANKIAMSTALFA